MNQKHIRFPCPRIFQALSLLQNFPLLPTSPPSYLPQLISRSLYFQSSGKLSSLSSTKLRGETQGLRKVESLMLKECEKEKTRGVLHPKCRSERRKIHSLPFPAFFFSYDFFFFMFFFFFLMLEKKKMPRRKRLKQKGRNRRP